jgi:threonine/homoserine/homoserine lactone efflux protein
MTGSLLLLVGATGVLVMIPGPNVALIVANSLRFGFRNGAATAVGTTTGVALQLVLVVLGLATVVTIVAEALAWIRWAGVAYLLYLGVRTWREAPTDLGKVEAAPPMFWRGCVIAVLNPKTLLFNAAFIPQFVGEGGAIAADLGLVAAVFLTVLIVGDLMWAAFASSARPLLVRYSSAHNKLAGAFLGVAGVGLALARQ